MLFHCTTIAFFIGFRVGDSDGNAGLIRQRSHICSSICFIGSRILGILGILGLYCVGFELFILTINLDVVSSFSVFSTLIYVFRFTILLF